MNGQAEVEVDYKRKYKNLKRKLKFLVYVSILFCLLMFSSSVRLIYTTQLLTVCIRSYVQEQECFQEELRRAQRKLLKVSRDKR